MPNIVFVTCNQQPNFQENDRLVVDALREKGASVSAVPWNQANNNLSHADLIIVRSTWDYPKYPKQFLMWLKNYEYDERFLNPSKLMQWNMDKRYLLELAAQGVTLIDTREAVGTVKDIMSAMEHMSLQTAIVKPVIGATASGICKVNRNDIASIAKAAETCARKPCLIQPFMQEIMSDGEASLIFVDGVFSHAVLKQPQSGDFRVQKEHGGSTSILSSPLQRTVEAALHVIRLLPEPPLYARIDFVVTPTQDYLMEVELIEPDLFFDYSPQSSETFALAIMQRLKR